LLVETVDVITPIVDDPYTFGAICAANAVSDVYAMGGKPLTALAILGFASCDFGASVIRRLLKGAIDKLKEADTCLIGGHSIEDNEFKFGFAIIGAVSGSQILRAGNAKIGDILILTKPLGTGILTSAFKLGKLKKNQLKDVVSSMLTLNKNASQIALQSGARAATDVTGFGLLGHALTIAEMSKVTIVIKHKNVPLLNGVESLISEGVVPKGARKNFEFCKKHVLFMSKISEARKLALSDPQTSGGLLIALPESGLKRFKTVSRKKKLPFWIIGEVKKGKSRIVIQ
jgi:selenide,water dikinase